MDDLVNSEQMYATNVEELLARNASAYLSLVKVELILREKISQSLKEGYGASWLRTRCMPLAKERYHEAVRHAKTNRIWQRMPLTPLYFVDFPHLREIMIRGDNWREVFSKIFDEKLMDLLRGCEPIRNSIAHSRFISLNDLNYAQCTLSHLRELLGESECERHIENAAKFESINNIISEIEKVVRSIESSVAKCDIVADESLVTLSRLKYYNWLDSELFNVDISDLNNIYGEIREYNQLDRRPGYYYKVEKYVEEHDLRAKISSCINLLEIIKEEINA